MPRTPANAEPASRHAGGFDRPIVERTGLEGCYDVSVQYQSADPLSVTKGGASLVAAAEDQLGLKFERVREMVDVLVIESVEPPTPDWPTAAHKRRYNPEPETVTMIRPALALAALAFTGALAGSIGTLAAQTPTPTFEIASIKPNVSGAFGGDQGVRPGGVFSSTNRPVVRLIQFAYNLRDLQIVGGPDWVRTDRFDVTAKTAADVPVDQVRLMVRALLADRFKLRVRHEQREMPFFELVLARTDGRVGPNLHDCSNAQDRAGISSPEKPFMAPRGGTVAAGDCNSLASIASMVSGRMQALVIDKTGLSGRWRYNIYFGPDLPLGDSAVNVDLPSFVGALREQLGLKLERTRGPFDVLVIDSVERPTPD